MHQSAESEPGPAAAGFAGLLASLTASPKLSASPWSDDGLADDVATISYEPALRKQSRGPGPEPGSESLASSTSTPGRDFATPGQHEEPPPTPAASSGHPLKRASITIRLTESECGQLRLRAAEAGLTISAYLRSCILEVESLRAQVKDALAQLRESAPAPAVHSSSRQKRWFLFWSRRPDAADLP